MSNDMIPVLTEEQRKIIHDSRSPYSAEDRICAVMCYIVAGGSSKEAARKASEAIGQHLTPETLRQWKSRAPWWPEAETVARGMLQQSLDRKYTRILELTEAEISDRIKDGDHHMNKDGDLVRVPIKFRDLVTGHAIISDKRAMLRGNPTSRKEDTGLALLLRLAQEMQKDGTKKIGETVDAEYTEVKDAKFT